MFRWPWPRRPVLEEGAAVVVVVVVEVVDVVLLGVVGAAVVLVVRPFLPLRSTVDLVDDCFPRLCRPFKSAQPNKTLINLVIHSKSPNYYIIRIVNFIYAILTTYFYFEC